MKEKIEKEIKKIEDSQLKVFGEITSSFKKKHLELEKEEKDLTFELITKVTKIKNELENSLKESDKKLSICEKIIQAGINFEKTFNQNELKKLYYIIEMKKKEEETKNFIKKKIKNYSICFDNEYNEISFDEYYFNVIPIPKDINYEIKADNLLLTWKIGDSKIEEPYEYIIQINVNNKEKIYKTPFNQFLLEKYESNVEYEVKIRVSSDDEFGDWSEIKNFKIDSNSNNTNIFFTSGLFNSKNNDNYNKKNYNIFGEPNPINNTFDFSNNNKNDKSLNLFSNFKAAEKNLFDSYNKDEKKESLFGNSYINEKLSLFEDSNKEKNDKNNDKASLFTFHSNQNIFGNINNEKKEEKEEKNSIFAELDDKVKENPFIINSDNNKK